LKPSKAPKIKKKKNKKKGRGLSEDIDPSGDVDPSGANDVWLKLKRGGFQEARGDCNNGGQEWFVENAKSMLDSPLEYYLDLANRKLYFIPPVDMDLAGATVELSSQRILMRARGNGAGEPITELHVKNLGFHRTYPTHMDKNHEVPSAGVRCSINVYVSFIGSFCVVLSWTPNPLKKRFWLFFGSA
jgi:hypothetical protein